MDEDDELLALPPDLFDDLKTRGWRFISAGFDSVLLEEARGSAQRAADAAQAGQRRREWGATASAVLCASAACEARVSEYLVHWEAVFGPLPAELAAIRGKGDALEQWRLLVRNRAPRYDLAGSREYQHLGCLIRLRDVVAHRNSRLRQIGSVPEQISDCVRQGTIPLPVGGGGGDWPTLVLVHRVASWAVETSTQWLHVVDDLLPLRC